MPRTRSLKDADPRWLQSRWTYFFIFLIANSLLSYAPLSLSLKLGIFLAGILLPFFLALRAWVPASKKNDLFRQETFPVPGWTLGLLLLAAIALRFTGAEKLSIWPLMDEGRAAFFSMELDQHWDWRLFYGYSQIPPFFYWALSNFFRLFSPSLHSLWTFSALVSLSLVPMAYLAGRKVFSRSFNFLFFFLVALSFWPIYFGRFVAEGIGVIFWESLTLWGLVLFLKSPSSARSRPALGLGALTAAGFYIHLHWPFIALIILVAVIQQYRMDKKGIQTLVYFFIPLVLIPLPLLFSALHQGFGSYIQSLFVSQHADSGFGRLYVAFSYLTSLFWGVDYDLFAYRPINGGFLNPIMGACFFIGALELYGRRGEWIIRWGLFSFLLFLVPGLLTTNLETFRIIPLLPFLLMAAALGAQVLLSGIPRPKRAWVLFLLLFPSFLIDSYRLTASYQKWWVDGLDHWATYSKSYEQWRAYSIIQKEFESNGPGALFIEFDSYPFDRSLAVASHPYTSLGKGPGVLGTAKWAGFLTNVNYRPFLAKRFPNAKWDWVDEGKDTFDGGLMMAVIPVTDQDRPILEKWAQANKALERSTLEMLNRPWVHSRTMIVQDLLVSYDRFRGDPYLESLFWNMVYLNESADGDFEKGREALDQAIERGYPTAYFFNELGSFYTMKRDFPRAKQAFERALRSPENFTPAAENLKISEGMAMGRP